MRAGRQAGRQKENERARERKRENVRARERVVAVAVNDATTDDEQRSDGYKSPLIFSGGGGPFDSALRGVSIIIER